MAIDLGTGYRPILFFPRVVPKIWADQDYRPIQKIALISFASIAIAVSLVPATLWTVGIVLFSLAQGIISPLDEIVYEGVHGRETLSLILCSLLKVPIAVIKSLYHNFPLAYQQADRMVNRGFSDGMPDTGVGYHRMQEVLTRPI